MRRPRYSIICESPSCEMAHRLAGISLLETDAEEVISQTEKEPNQLRPCALGVPEVHAAADREEPTLRITVDAADANDGLWRCGVDAENKGADGAEPKPSWGVDRMTGTPMKPPCCATQGRWTRIRRQIDAGRGILRHRDSADTASAISKL